MPAPDYSEKLERFAPQTLLPVLEPATRSFVERIAADNRFTFQELRKVAEAARDLEMWTAESLESWWRRTEPGVPGEGKPRKKALLALFDQHMSSLRSAATTYPEEGLAPPPRRSVRLEETERGGEVFGMCPAYSEHTVCCGLRTIDAVRGCPFGCSYCTIQTFYGETAELEENLAEKLDSIELDPDHLYHIGTGQASDSLVWGDRGGALDALLGFARKHPNVVLELKTKSDNVKALLDREESGPAVPRNVLCSWSLAPDTVITNEEHGTASLERRLTAARRVADRGLKVGFHFHPMVLYDGWREEYAEIATDIQQRFCPDEVAFVTMGAPTFIRPVIQEIRRRGGETRILQMDLVPDHHGKLTYPDEAKIELYSAHYASFEAWHSKVFFYLCMETAEMWESTLGFAFPTNAEFERSFAGHCLGRG
jgi:spore photoproduct lyase